MHQDTEVLILNFPLGEDSVCWCYLNHSPNLVIDECRVNRSIKLLQSTTEREPYTESQRQPEEALFFSLPSRQHMNLQVHVGDMYTHENLTRILYKGFPYYVCIDIHVSFLSDSADKTKRVTSTNSARVHEYLCSVRLLRRLTALECGQWWETLTSHNFCCGSIASWHLGCCGGETNLHRRSALNCNHIGSSCPRWTWLKWTTAQLFEMSRGCLEEKRSLVIAMQWNGGSSCILTPCWLLMFRCHASVNDGNLLRSIEHLSAGALRGLRDDGTRLAAVWLKSCLV